MNKHLTLTIISVVFNIGHEQFLKKNIQLIQKLNPQLNIKWLVCNNRLDKHKLKINNIKEVNGVVYPKNIPPVIRGSYHHASALNKLINLTKTRFVLTLDPDFFIIRPNAILEILRYMDKHNLDMIGATWNPKWYNKIRYFPSAHCLFINLKKINKKKLDFLPGYTKKEYLNLDKKSLLDLIYLKIKNKTLKDLLFSLNFSNRLNISSSKDTGYKIYLNKKIIFEYFTPSFRYKNNNLILDSSINSSFNRIVEYLLPDRLSYIPKNKKSFTNQQFIKNDSIEQFYWQNKPFGIHFRGVARNSKYFDFNKKLKFIKTAINTII